MADSPEQFEDETQESSIMMLRWPWYWRLVGGVLALSILLFISFQVAYIGKIYPGVSANGVSLSGMSKAQAVDKLNEQIKDFSIHTLAISYGSTVLRVPLSDLEVKYDAQKAAELAYDYGRQGGWSRRFPSAHFFAKRDFGRAPFLLSLFGGIEQSHTRELAILCLRS